ncbi:hypothetical protein SEUCBS140593_003033 [Sporothrix eucalyptigena]|uniref:Major facilitator superfamily (MFS) profile domain-containing protein n=1 Tax=Sporothrix eucalyptigena TaxID=1812306 RepID=A0ABP0BBF3_9PEZI
MANTSSASSSPATTTAHTSIGIDDNTLLRMAEAVPNLAELIDGAKRAANFEHSLTTLQAFLQYRRAMVFSMVTSLAIIMEGYDTYLLSSFIGLPTFQKRFGIPLGDGTYQITSKWQSGLSNGS